MTEPLPPTIALLPWGDLLEDFLDGLGVSLEAFCTEMTGGWLFGYVEALRRAGVRSVLVCVSARVVEPARFVHQPTGAAVWVLPAPAPYLRLRCRMRDPYGWTLEAMFGEARGLRQRLNRMVRDVAPYLATPPRRLAAVLRQERCTAILCQEYEYPRFDVAVAVGRRLGLPVFATFQGGDWQSSRIERFLRPRSLRAAAGLIIPTRTEIERVRARYGVPDGRIAPIFNPLDVAAWCLPAQRTARGALGIPEAARVAAWHGRVDLHRKGLDVLLDAWAQLVRERTGRDLRLLLIGTGPDAGRLRERLAAPVFEGVHWVDEYILDRDRLRCLLAAADVYAFPSRHEGSPVALMEAMASGFAVAAADAPGVADILGTDDPAGLLVPREDAPALATALGRLLDDDALAQALGQKAQQRAEAFFGLDAVGAQLQSFLLDARAPR